MSRVIEKFISVGGLAEFKKIFIKWQSIIDRHLEHSNYEDAPWWYNERATLSTFAFAATNLGHVVLEEYRTDKNHEERTKYGRCDLFIGTRKNNLPIEDYAIEAKQIWCKIGTRSSETVTCINKSISLAVKDTKRLDRDEGKRLAISFIVPELPPSDEDVIDKQISKWQSELKENYAGNIAWYFPKNARQLANHKGYYYPGIVTIIKGVHRGHKKISRM